MRNLASIFREPEVRLEAVAWNLVVRVWPRLAARLSRRVGGVLRALSVSAFSRRNCPAWSAGREERDLMAGIDSSVPLQQVRRHRRTLGEWLMQLPRAPGPRARLDRLIASQDDWTDFTLDHPPTTPGVRHGVTYRG